MYVCASLPWNRKSNCSYHNHTMNGYEHTCFLCFALDIDILATCLICPVNDLKNKSNVPHFHKFCCKAERNFGLLNSTNN